MAEVEDTALECGPDSCGEGAVCRQGLCLCDRGELVEMVQVLMLY